MFFSMKDIQWVTRRTANMFVNPFKLNGIPQSYQDQSIINKKKVSEYDPESSQTKTANKPVVPF